MPIASRLVWLPRAVFMVTLTFAAAACRSPGGESDVREFEDSLAICSEVRAAAEALQEGEPEERFRRVKAREVRILDDLLSRTTGPQNAEYARQKTRLMACLFIAPAGEQAAVDRRNEEKRSVLIEEIAASKSLKDLCAIGTRTQLVTEKTDSCQAGLLRSACDRVATGTAGDEEGSVQAYRGALTGCVRSLAGERAAEVAEAFATEVKRELDQGKDVGEALLVAACRGGAKLTGDRVQAIREVDYDEACGSLFSSSRARDKSRLASCFRTASDACEVFVGHGGMRLDRLIPSDGSQRDQLLRDIYLGLDTAVCATDPNTSLACKTIGAAAEQIVQAATTGNNDWAHCVGTDQLGACIGTLYGSQGWTNDNGVEMAKGVGESAQRACCWCKKNYFADDGWLSDTRYRQENWFGVIQAGDVASGNCKFKEQGSFPGDKEASWHGSETYYRYSNCGRRTVKGSSCAAQGGVHTVWNPTRKAWEQVRVP